MNISENDANNEIQSDKWDTMTTKELDAQRHIITTRLQTIGSLTTENSIHPALMGVQAALINALDVVNNKILQRLS